MALNAHPQAEVEVQSGGVDCRLARELRQSAELALPPHVHRRPRGTDAVGLLEHALLAAGTVPVVALVHLLDLCWREDAIDAVGAEGPRTGAAHDQIGPVRAQCAYLLVDLTLQYHPPLCVGRLSVVLPVVRAGQAEEDAISAGVKRHERVHDEHLG